MGFGVDVDRDEESGEASGPGRCLPLTTETHGVAATSPGDGLTEADVVLPALAAVAAGCR